MPQRAATTTVTTQTKMQAVPNHCKRQQRLKDVDATNEDKMQSLFRSHFAGWLGHRNWSLHRIAVHGRPNSASLGMLGPRTDPDVGGRPRCSSSFLVSRSAASPQSCCKYTHSGLN
eukprot:6457478-Amphidinium_carterae.2